MENEKRLIDANELMDGLKSLTGMFTDEIGFAVSLKSVLWKIDALPTVDAVEVKRGRWEDSGIPKPLLSGCSVCGFIGCGAYSFNYCPNCGAKMDGDGNA